MPVHAHQGRGERSRMRGGSAAATPVEQEPRGCSWRREHRAASAIKGNKMFSSSTKHLLLLLVAPPALLLMFGLLLTFLQPVSAASSTPVPGEHPALAKRDATKLGKQISAHAARRFGNAEQARRRISHLCRHRNRDYPLWRTDHHDGPQLLHEGEHVHLGYGLTSRRLTNPAIELKDLPPIDLIVLSICMKIIPTGSCKRIWIAIFLSSLPERHRRCSPSLAFPGAIP